MITRCGGGSLLALGFKGGGGRGGTGSGSLVFLNRSSGVVLLSFVLLLDCLYPIF